MTRCKNPAHWDEPQDACPLCDGDTRAAAEQIVNTWQKGSLAHAVRVDWGQLIADVEHALQQAGQPLRWTKQRPDKPGWYWYWDGENHESKTICWVYYSGYMRLRVMFSDQVKLLNEVRGGEFAGPIALPEECQHVWGIDGQHNNEYCKKCFVDKEGAPERR